MAVAALVAVLVHRSRRRRAIQSWQSESRAAVDAAHLALNLLPGSEREIVDRAHWQAVRARVEEAAQLLERAASTAPTEEGAAASRRSAEALRGLGFALESSLLVREAATAPSGTQLAEADIATREGRLDAEQAVSDLDRVVAVRPRVSAPPS